VIGTRAILDEGHEAVSHVVSPHTCGDGRIGIPAIGFGFAMSAVHGLLARDAEGGEPTPVLRLCPDLPASVTDPLDLVNGVRQSARFHGTLLDAAA